MKKYILLLTLFVFSCNSPSDNQANTEIIMDSVIVKSQQNLQNSDLIQKKSDSVTKYKVSLIIKEVEKYKIERSVILNQLKVAKENYIVRIDTVFIETKKNFWGKEKRSVSVKSDTSQTEFLDSSSIEQVIDTTNHQ